MIIDSHIHFNDEELFPKIEEIIDRAKERGVKAAWFLEKETGRRVDGVIGVNLTLAQQILKAIGEIGLDYYWDKTHAEKQKDLFIKQINLANKHKLPIIIHMRDATNDTYEIIKEHKDKDLPGVMHCYSGSWEYVKNFTDLNLYISLAGPVTFKNAHSPKEIAKKIDLNKLLIETDAPYLAPVPHRGKTNESKNLKYIVKEISELRGVNVETIEEATYNNTVKLFNLVEL